MPRISFTENWSEEKERGQQFSPENCVIDLCKICFEDAKDEDFERLIPEEVPEEWRSTDGDEEHPPYDDWVYECHECGVKLGPKDD